jgi:hypothetical protein
MLIVDQLLVVLDQLDGFQAFGNHFQWFTFSLLATPMAFGHHELVCGGINVNSNIIIINSISKCKCRPSLFVFVNMSDLSLVTRSISSIYRFIVMLVAGITDVR